MKKILFLLLIALSAGVMAQRVRVVSGDYKFLKDQKFIKVIFKFDGVTFAKKKISEDQYIKDRMEDIEQTNGKEESEKWRKDWEYSKEKSFPDKFLASWNKNIDIKAATNIEQTKYTLIVEPTWISQGWFAGVVNEPAKLDSRMTFVETNNPGHVLLVVEGVGATGDNVIGIPNHNDRIAECYAKTSKMLALKANHYKEKK
jgi:hypothetical protein